jgi:hypothetical protein
MLLASDTSLAWQHEILGIAVHYSGVTVSALLRDKVAFLNVLTPDRGFGTGMAEAAVFISLSASVDQSLQAVALSGLFLFANIGLMAGLAGSSAVLEVSLRAELQRRLAGYDGKREVSLTPIEICVRFADPV